MDMQTQLITAIGALWLVLTGVVSKMLLWLLDDRRALKTEWSTRLETERTECRQEISRRDTKLDGASELLHRQNESMQKQIDAQTAMIITLQTALANRVNEA